MSTANLEYPVGDANTVTLEVKKYVDRWRDQEGNLIMILHEVQNQYGYVPREVSMTLAQELGISLARIYEVITFYHYFKLTPPGKHNILVCNGTACYLKGGARLLEELEKQLDIKEGETTEDREFHLETVRCIGCCGMSPSLNIDGKTYGRLTSKDILALIEGTRKKGGVQ